MSELRILIADDHNLVRAGLRNLLEKIDEVLIVGEAADGLEALRLIAERQPHVVLMDILMPGMNGLEATARAAKDFAGSRIIILSMNATEEYVLQALRAGASGYLLKNVSPDELARAVRAVARGERYLTASVSQHVIDAYLKSVSADVRPLERLTPRQREVLQLIAEGQSTKTIARKLKLSTKTIETHRMQLMQTLGIHDIAGLVRYAIRMGLIPAE